MMKLFKFPIDICFLWITAVASSVSVVMSRETTSSSSCPTHPITIAGAESVQRLTEAWKRAYTTFRQCPGATIEISGGGSFTGAARLCGTHHSLIAVDIGGMARQFNYGDATTENGWQFQCQRSPRKVIELAVAQEGIALVTGASGAAADCINNKLGGLSLDQLRWIYSSFTKEELIHDYWDETSLPFDDGNDQTHLWSELHEECEPVEIQLAGMRKGEPAYQFFEDVVLEGRDETVAFHRTISKSNTSTTTSTNTTTSNTTTSSLTKSSNSTINANNQSSNVSFYGSSSVRDLASYVSANDAAISFISLADLFSTKLRTSLDSLSTVSILNPNNENHAGGGDNNKQKFIDPKASAFSRSSAYPLSRRLYLNILNDPASLANMKPFLEFALSDQGTGILKSSGFWPLDNWERIVTATRAQTQEGIDMSEIQASCGPARGDIAMAGSSTVLPIANIWQATYKLGCPRVEIELEGGGSSAGAGRVCANPDKGSPVDIGMMSREWKTQEAVERSHGSKYDCLKGDTSRSVVRVDVAHDGITVAMQKGGLAQQCVEILGGLTMDQLRWIYSSYNETELEDSGWDLNSLKNSDNDSSTHLWSELDDRCAQVEIRLAGDPVGDGTYTSFVKTVLTDHKNGEHIGVERPPYGYHQGWGFSLASYLRQHSDAVSYMGFNYYFDNKDSISAAPIQNEEGAFVSPSKTAISDGSYSMERRVWMNLLNDRESLKDTVPMVKFGLANPTLISATGYVPLTESEVELMVQRLDAAYRGGLTSEEDDVDSLGIILGLVFASIALMFLGLALVVCFMRRGTGKEQGDAPTDGGMSV